MRRSVSNAMIFGLCGALAIALGTLAFSAPPPQQPPLVRKRPVRMPQTKRIGQGQLVAIIDGHPEVAVERCETVLQQQPNHLESLYNLAIAQANMGAIDQAVATMQRAIKAGLPAERFIVGPRGLMAPLAETPEFRRLADEVNERLLHGPMLGCMTDRSVKVWVRTAEETSIQVVASKVADLSQPVKSATVFTDADRDYTAVAEIVRLEPDTVYHYDVLVRGRSTLGPDYPTFRTYPPAGSAARFKVAFGGGAGYTPQHERMWNTLVDHKLDAFLFLGDNVYIDNPTRPDMQHYTYYRRQSRSEYRRFTARTPIYAIWDDHDFGVNDCFYGSAIDEPEFKVPVWRVFTNNWNNPGYGGGRRQPGCWFNFSIADVDFFMLDGRYYRSNPKRPNPTMLGRAQKAWLKEELKRSRGTFKVIASPVPWVLEAKGNSLDTWRGFEAEREEIFTFLEKNEIDGVVLISADRHRSDLWRIERDTDYPLYEFESSRLTNVHTHGPQPGCLFSYNAKCSFGQIGFDTTKADPQLTYQIYNIDNELIFTKVIRRSEISHE